MVLPEGTRLGPYEIVGLIGAGGMGEVYRARDPRLGRHVAIKILPSAFSTDSDRLWRFEREARAVASLNHPNICTVHDIGEHEGHRFLVMELLEGTTLSSRLATGPLPTATLLDLGIQIADALDAAHGAGVIHRDLKPANIFVTKRGEAKLLDFGLAKLTEDDSVQGAETALHVEALDAPTLAGKRGETSLGMLLGTAAYMSPEQARGEPADAQSDLFSFGVVLYEMATGKPAFSGKTMAVLFDGILNRDPRPIAEINPQIPAELSHIVSKAIEKEKDLRYRSASDIRGDLKRLRRDATPRRVMGEDGPVAAAAAPRPPAVLPSPAPSGPRVDTELPRRRPRRRVLRTVLILIAIAAVARSALRRRTSDNQGPQISLVNLQVKQLTETGNAIRPAISPDGKYIVYLEREAEETSSVWLRQTDATNSVKIFQSDPQRFVQAVTVGPDSTFVDMFRSDGVWRVPFLGGTPTLVVERAATPVGWSPDGRQMAFVGRLPEATQLALIVANADGSGEHALGTTGNPPAGFVTGLPGAGTMAPAWSPDGRRIAVMQRLGEDVRDIGVAVFDVASGQKQIVNVRGDAPQGLGWLDDATLAVSQALEAGTASQLWRVSFPDGHRTRLTNDVNRYSELSLAADRNTFVTSRPETRVSIWVGDAKGANGKDVVRAAPFLSAAAQYATVGFDGDARLLFTHTLNGRFDIFRLDLDKAGTLPEAVVAGRELAVAPDGTIVYRSVADEGGLWRVDRNGQHKIEVTKGTITYPSITPDGQQVVFNAPIDGVQLVARVPIAGGTPVPIVKAPVSIVGFSDVSPDGRSIVLARGRDWTICEFPACTTQKVFAPVNGSRPRWTRDGRAITYVSALDGSNLWVQPIDGTSPHQLTHFTDGASIGNFAWSPDGQRLAVSRATFSSDIVLFSGLTGRR
jgi:serine/threonine protein kinase/Tol biopolymer transport system component